MKKLIKVGSDCSGVGAFPQALIRLGIEFKEDFACDFDYYARQTYLLNFGTDSDIELSKSKEHKKYADGVQKIALSNKEQTQKDIAFLKEANEFAKKFSFYYPFNMYEREIPNNPLDVYMGSFPCQSFSLAGSRKGEASKKGILFYNGHEFIQKNKPRYFIIENVKGLLSDDSGKTFQKWIDYLGGKSVNGNPVIFPHENATPYHVYYQVLNAKHYGVPQNRERIFIVGIRDDADNDFKFPKPFHLVKRLKDVLESEVDEKYFLSESNINALVKYNERQVENDRGFSAKFRDVETVKTMDALKCGGGGKDDLIKIGAIRGREIKVAKVGRSEEGKKQRKESMAKGKDYTPFQSKEITFEESDIMNCITTATTKDNLIQTLEINENGTSNALTTVQKDNVVIIQKSQDYREDGSLREFTDYSPTLRANMGDNHPMVKTVIIPTNNSKGYDIAEEEEDSINFSNPNSETRRGRVGHGVAQTLDTSCNQGIVTRKPSEQEAEWIKGGLQENQPKQTNGISPCLTSAMGMGGGHTPITNIKTLSKQQQEKFDNLQVDENVAGCITEAIGRAGSSDEYISSVKRNALITQRIRRLTPKECMKLMGFNEDFIEKTINSKQISDSQLYKQCGNSIVVDVLALIISKLNL